MVIASFEVAIAVVIFIVIPFASATVSFGLFGREWDFEELFITIAVLEA